MTQTHPELDKFNRTTLLVALLALGIIVHAQHALGQRITPRSKDCPITAIKITPHVYMFRIYDSVCIKYSGGSCAETKRGEGWIRSNRMALDLVLENVGNRDIAALTFHITDRGAGSVQDWDDVPVNLKPGEITSLFYPSNNYRLIDVSFWRDKSVIVELYGLRYGDGEIVSTSCSLGSAPIPEAFQPVKADPNSHVYEGNPDSPPRVLESYDLPQPKQKMPWDITPQEQREYGAKMQACNNLRRQTQNPTLDCVPPSGKVTHAAVFSLVVGEDGLPRNIKLKSGTLGENWDEKEIELLRKWSFGPATKDGKPVAWRIDITVKYAY